jgi:hypothetical protein
MAGYVIAAHPMARFVPARLMSARCVAAGHAAPSPR